MENKIQSPVPVLVTLTAPSASGKSYLLNYIRDVAKLSCLVSTTTRPPRKGEVEGVDYYFISEQESKDIEAADEFAELAVYRGVRYGVTKNEFMKKLARGVAFLIVEPSGIDHYVKPALDVGAKHLKYFINTPIDKRIERFKKRTEDDMRALIENNSYDNDLSEPIIKMIKVAMDRLVAILTEETKWFEMCQWDRVLDGTTDPMKNLEIILRDVKNCRLTKQK